MTTTSAVASLPAHYIVLGMGVVTFFTYEMPAYVHAALAVTFICTLMIISAWSDDGDETKSEEKTLEREEVRPDKPLAPKSIAAARAAAIEMAVDVPPPSPSTTTTSAYSSSAPSTASFSFSSLPSTPRTPSTPGSARRVAFARQLQRRAQLAVGLTSRSRNSTSVLVGLKGTAGCMRRRRRRSTSRRSSRMRV